MAEAYEFSTVGLSCRKALECDYYDVDETVIHGEDWGDDSPQLMKEAQMAKELKLTKKPTKLIRTDKWTLNPTTEQRLLLDLRSIVVSVGIWWVLSLRIGQSWHHSRQTREHQRLSV